MSSVSRLFFQIIIGAFLLGAIGLCVYGMVVLNINTVFASLWASCDSAVTFSSGMTTAVIRGGASLLPLLPGDWYWNVLVHVF